MYSNESETDNYIFNVIPLDIAADREAAIRPALFSPLRHLSLLSPNLVIFCCATSIEGSCRSFSLRSLQSSSEFSDKTTGTPGSLSGRSVPHTFAVFAFSLSEEGAWRPNSPPRPGWRIGLPPTLDIASFDKIGRLKRE